MNSAAEMVTTMDLAPAREPRLAGVRSFGGYVRRNPSLGVGIFLLVALLLFVVIGHLTVDTSQYRPLSVRPLQPPSWELPFGSDKQGRNLYAVMVLGTPVVAITILLLALLRRLC